MDVLGGAVTLPFDIVQHIQDQDASIHLHKMCKGVRVRLYNYGYTRMVGKNLRGRRGAIMYAYSSGDPIQVANCVRPRKIHSRRHIDVYSKLRAQQGYIGIMEEFKKLSLVPSYLHYKYILI